MEENEAIVRLAALATPSRLAVIRVLAEAGPDGLASGQIAKRLNTQPNTLSTQLLLLSNARIVKSRREGRSIVYTLRPEAKDELFKFLEDTWIDTNRSAGERRVAS